MGKFTVDTYSPEDVILTIGGYQLTAWETISISRRVDTFVPVFGIRGKHTSVPTGDTSATIVIPLLQTSASNDVLSAIHDLDSQNGTGRLILMLKDNSGRSIFSSDEGRIMGYPETVYSGGFEYRAWKIWLQSTSTYIVGGNSSPSTSIFDGALNAASNFVSSL